MCDIIQFPNKLSNKAPQASLEELETDEDKLAYWKARNDIIADEFHTYPPHKKQEILETVLEMNFELYELVLKLKKGEKE